MQRLDWKPIRATATAVAEAMGHKLSQFDTARARQHSVRMASCMTCGGCCWISYRFNKGFSAGGRLLIYPCGTNEAIGIETRKLSSNEPSKVEAGND